MSNNLLISEDQINVTEGYRSGESGVFECFTDHPGELFRALRRNYGRCTGKVRVDVGNSVKAIGWVFEKRRKYDDCDETYLLETWVTVHEKKPTRTIEYHYREV